MTIEVDVFGYRYDDVEPAFMRVRDNHYYHLRTKRLFKEAEFDTKLAADGKAFGANELGYPSLQLMLRRETMLQSFAAPIGSAQMNINVTKVPVGADDTGEITVVGGPTDDPIVYVLTTKDSTSAESTIGVYFVQLEEQLTADEVAAEIAGEIAVDPNFVSVAAVGPVITFTPSAGGSIDVLISDTQRPF